MKGTDFLVINASRYPEKTAVLYRGQRFNYREVNERVNRLAHHLMDLGVQKGDHVGFMFYNSNQFVEIFYATQKIGALAVPMNFRMVPREVKWILDNARCKVFAYSEACSKQVDPVKKDFSTVEHLIYSGQNVPSGEYHFETFTQEGLVEEPKVKVEFEDKASIQYTGGTTGSPKGAVHTHRSSILSLMNCLIALNISATEIMLNQLPMFHVAGFNMMNLIMSAGGTFIIVETFDPLEILHIIDKLRPTLIFLIPPATYTRLMDVPNLVDFDTTSVKKVISSAGSLSQRVALRIFDIFPNAVLSYSWGLTETYGAGTLHWITRSMVKDEPEKLKSVGRVMPFLEVRLVDEKGRDVPRGQVGEAIVRSFSNMEEYFEQPELTSQTIEDGWVHTGDLLRKDGDGFYYFIDRKKDMIKSGGENVFAQEVEGVILAHIAVEHCAVIGVPDPKFQEAVMAVIKLRPGYTASEEEIIEHCKKHLSSYKKPRRVVFVEDLPWGPGGKVQKFLLREQYRKLGEEEGD